MKSEPGGTGYLPAVDGLRTVAIAFVFLVHIYPDYFPGGYVGVDLFFAISGYLITSLLVKEANATGQISLANFYARRSLRIFPALIVCVVFVYFAVPYTIGQQENLTTLAALFAFMNWLRALTNLDGGSLGHTWSLSVEEQFYFFWALIALVATRFRGLASLVWIALVGVILVAFWRLYLTLNGAPPARTFNGLDTRADAILVGCLLALLGGQYESALKFLARFWIIPLLGMLAVIVTTPWEAPVLANFTVIAIFSSWILAMAVYGSGWQHKLLSSAPMRWMGKRSYSFYLWHMPILAVAHSLEVSRTLSALPALALSILAAHLSYEFVEKPFLRLKHAKLRREEAPARMEFGHAEKTDG